MRSALLCTATLNTQFNLNIDRIGSVIAAQPPLEEQYTIVEHLKTQVGKINRLVAKIDVSVTKLHEYRTALISAAVTGKIDVRKEVA
jgi:type I restriction enzyme S subunit